MIDVYVLCVCVCVCVCVMCMCNVYGYVLCVCVCVSVFEDSILSSHKHGVVFLQKNLKSINPTSKD